MSQKNYQNNNNFFKKHWKTLLIFVLIISNIAIYFGVKPEPQNDPGIEYRQKYPLLDGNRRLANVEDLIVNLQPLRDYLKKLPEQNKEWADMSIYFESLNTGASVTVNVDLQLWPASLAKLPAAMVAMKKVEKGDWTLETKLQMLAEDADLERTPDIVSEIGKSFDIKFLLERLLLESDNTAYKMIVRNLSDEELNSIGQLVGLEEIFTDNGKISAKDYSRLFRALYLAVYLNEDNSQFLLTLLQDSDFKDFVRAGVPSSTPYAHKWGTNLHISTYADSGIVYVDKRPYIISIMIQGKSANEDENRAKASALMKEIGQKTHDYMSQK